MNWSRIQKSAKAEPKKASKSWLRSRIPRTFCPWIMACVASVRTELYESFNGQAVDRQATVLVELSKKLFHNSLRLLKVDETRTLDQYSLSFNGPNIRWETVGIFFTTVGLAKMKRAPQGLGQLPAWAGRTGHYVLALRMIDFGQLCLNFCEEAGHLTDAEIWIRYELAVLTSVTEGDASTRSTLAKSL